MLHPSASVPPDGHEIHQWRPVYKSINIYYFYGIFWGRLK